MATSVRGGHALRVSLALEQEDINYVLESCVNLPVVNRAALERYQAILIAMGAIFEIDRQASSQPRIPLEGGILDQSCRNAPQTDYLLPRDLKLPNPVEFVVAWGLP